MIPGNKVNPAVHAVALLRSKTLPAVGPVAVLVGEERHLKRGVFERLVQDVLGGDEESLGLTRFAGEDAELKTVCDELLTLDPTRRGLGPAERFQRSLKLVELTLDQTRECAGQNPPPELRGLIEKAGKALKAHVSAARQGEAFEANLDLAEQLWQARKKECNSPPATDTPLELVLARLAQ